MQDIRTTVRLAVVFGGVVLAVPCGPAVAEVITIDTSSQDAWTRPGVPTTNYGDSQELNVLSSSGDWWMQSYVQFDISSVPTGMTIVSAELLLYNHSITWAGRADGTVSVYRITDPWIEGNGGTDDDPAGELVEDNKPGHDSVALDDILFYGDGTGSNQQATLTPNEWRTWDVTEAIEAWYSGAEPNYGLYLTRGSGGSLHIHFRTKEYGSGAYAPMLVVNFVPEPSTLALALGALLGLAMLGFRRRK